MQRTNHVTDSKPIFGFMQPTYGPDYCLDFRAMGAKTKRPKFIAIEAREVLSNNVRTRMEREFQGIGDKPAALAKRIGVSKSTVQRVLDANATGTSIDVLAQIAMGLRCDPSDLLRKRSAA